MGMDVFGAAPIAPVGEYFRNNLWYWRPLWTYVIERHNDLLPGDPQEGFYNDGYSLNKNEAAALGAQLLHDIKIGITVEWEQDFNRRRADADLVTCTLCTGTGIRTDDIGIEHGHPDRELETMIAIVTGRTHGWCNGCLGLGHRVSDTAAYHFTIDNVREFAMFLMTSGGCSIY